MPPQAVGVGVETVLQSQYLEPFVVWQVSRAIAGDGDDWRCDRCYRLGSIVRHMERDGVTCRLEFPVTTVEAARPVDQPSQDVPE